MRGRDIQDRGEDGLLQVAAGEHEAGRRYRTLSPVIGATSVTGGPVWERGLGDPAVVEPNVRIVRTSPITIANASA
jgi:hypothetical protein